METDLGILEEAHNMGNILSAWHLIGAAVLKTFLFWRQISLHHPGLPGMLYIHQGSLKVTKTTCLYPLSAGTQSVSHQVSQEAIYVC